MFLKPWSNSVDPGSTLSVYNISKLCNRGLKQTAFTDVFFAGALRVKVQFFTYLMTNIGLIFIIVCCYMTEENPVP